MIVFYIIYTEKIGNLKYYFVASRGFLSLQYSTIFHNGKEASFMYSFTWHLLKFCSGTSIITNLTKKKRLSHSGICILERQMIISSRIDNSIGLMITSEVLGKRC